MLTEDDTTVKLLGLTVNNKLSIELHLNNLRKMLVT